MRAFHNSRDGAYRDPYGVIVAGSSVVLAIDVWDAPGARVSLRTWIDGAGEGLREMRRVPASAVENVDGAGDAGRGRFEVDFAPEEPGVVWYQFVITDSAGNSKRYGAREGCLGGVGQLLDWEPPSFKLTVVEPHTDEASPSGAGDFPFTDDIMRFMRREATAAELVETIEGYRENNVPAKLDRASKLLGGRSDGLLLAQLSGAAPLGDVPEGQLAGVRMDDGQRDLGKKRMWCASLIQMLMPAETAVYSDGDAAPKEACGPVGAGGSAASACDGRADSGDDLDDARDARPRNRAFPGDGDRDCETIVRNAYDVRHALPLFTEGGFACFAANDDVFGIWREGDDGTAACLLANASPHDAHDVVVPLVGEAVSELIDGYGLPIVDASSSAGVGCVVAGERPPHCVRARLRQLGCAILYFHPEQRLNQPMEAGLGVLAHITSLPTGASQSEGGRRRPGTLGAPSRAFVDWLAEAGVRYWQVLPVNPTDEFGSPYAGISAFAGNTRLLERACDADGAFTADAAGGAPDSASAENAKALADPDGYRAFCEREADWLEPYAAFMSIRQKLGTGTAWQEWPEEYRRYTPDIIGGDLDLLALAEGWRRAQFAFERQWEDLRRYANERGVLIVGDMPIYVSSESADVWANPEIFQLGADGRPEVVAGCPPDQFAAEGQIWGNPVYDWDVLEADGYRWWLRRLERAFGLYDLVRLDHFIGFSRYFAIPAGEKATQGEYRPGPGLDFFRCAQKWFGPLPVIAEDLGSITPAVRALGAACGFPGMDIVQFVDGNDPLSGYRPRPEKIAYAGTHDNQTLVGYASVRYPELDAGEVAGKLAELVVCSGAPVCVLQLQDLIGLDDGARMNVPGIAEGNWTWQAESCDVEAALERTRMLVNLQRAAWR